MKAPKTLVELATLLESEAAARSLTNIGNPLTAQLLSRMVDVLKTHGTAGYVGEPKLLSGVFANTKVEVVRNQGLFEARFANGKCKGVGHPTIEAALGALLKDHSSALGVSIDMKLTPTDKAVSAGRKKVASLGLKYGKSLEDVIDGEVADKVADKMDWESFPHPDVAQWGPVDKTMAVNFQSPAKPLESLRILEDAVRILKSDGRNLEAVFLEVMRDNPEYVRWAQAGCDHDKKHIIRLVVQNFRGTHTGPPPLLSALADVHLDKGYASHLRRLASVIKLEKEKQEAGAETGAAKVRNKVSEKDVKSPPNPEKTSNGEEDKKKSPLSRFLEAFGLS